MSFAQLFTRGRENLLPVAIGTLMSGCAADLWPNDERLGVCTVDLPVVEAGDDLAVPATEGSARVRAVSIRGSGEYLVGDIRLSEGQGTIDLGCQELAVVVYGRDDAEHSKQFYALAVSEDRIYRLRFQCRAEGELQYVTYFGTDGTASSSEWATGSCRERPAITARLHLPATSMPLPSTVTGYSMDGAMISLSREGKGTIVLDAVEQELLALHSYECGPDCSDRPYVRLDSLVWNPAAPEIRPALLYLYDDTPSTVSVLPEAVLPGLRPWADWMEFEATFTTP